MMEPRNLSALYWRGGPARVSIEYPRIISQCAVDKAIKILEAFRDDCQRQYITFFTARQGNANFLDRFRHVWEQQEHGNENPMISIGSRFPNLEQSPGQSTIVQMPLSDFLEWLRPGGESENQHTKALIVFMYHLWEEGFRKKIADSLSISQDWVKCDLMGDIRHIRNCIIHNNSVISQDLLNRLKILSQIWDIRLGKLLISENMIHLLMEQINAIRVTIKSDS